MASAPSDSGPVLGRLDGNDRLVSADPALAELQSEAGARIGSEIALPQVAAVARLARRLGVPVSRPAVAAGADRDIDLWVRAVPEGEEVLLSLERWIVRPPRQARLGILVAHDQEVGIGAAPDEWATDAELRIVSMTEGLADKLGIQAATAIGQPLTKLLKLEENEDGEMPLLAAAATRGSFSGQRARPRTPDSPTLVLAGRAVMDEGAFTGFEGEAVDEEAASSGTMSSVPTVDQALDEALRSPLDGIIDSADRIVQQAEGPLRSDYAEYASDIAVAARHLLSVIRTMRGDRRGGEDLLDVAELAAEAAGMLEAAAEERKITIAVQSPGPVMVHGDSRGIIQILVNLVGNAVRHSPDGGIVSLSFERSDGRVRVHVADQGAGIAVIDQQRIFERFERGDPAGSGTGLGLAIARRLARSMDGDVTLESAPGKGARFTLDLAAA